MVDLKKRETLKFAALSGTLAGLGSANLMARNLRVEQGLLDSVPAAHYTNSNGISDLAIEVFSGENEKRDTVVLTNLTRSTLRVNHFKPGSIFWDDHYLDLNALRCNVGIILGPESTLNLSVVRQYLGTDFIPDYVWADDAVEQLDPTTRKLTLGAYLSNSQLFVYPVPLVKNQSLAIA